MCQISIDDNVIDDKDFSFVKAIFEKSKIIIISSSKNMQSPLGKSI